MFCKSISTKWRLSSVWTLTKDIYVRIFLGFNTPYLDQHYSFFSFIVHSLQTTSHLRLNKFKNQGNRSKHRRFWFQSLSYWWRMNRKGLETPCKTWKSQLYYSFCPLSIKFHQENYLFVSWINASYRRRWGIFQHTSWTHRYANGDTWISTILLSICKFPITHSTFSYCMQRTQTSHSVTIRHSWRSAKEGLLW